MLKNLDSGRVVKMVLYSIAMGGAAGFAAMGAGASQKSAACAAAVAFCTNLGAYWATSPKSGAGGGDDAAGQS